MEDKPRYSRITDIIELMILMQAKLDGVSLSDIQEHFNVSRRTAERMRDSLTNLMPEIQEIETNERCKRWGFVNYSLSSIVSFTPEEIASLERIKNECNDVSKKEVENILIKLKALNNKKLSSIENEIEFVLHSEGYAVKQTPKYNIDLTNISIIREAIKNNIKIKATYNEKEKLLSPLGLIYGEKIHLIAREEDKGMGEYNYLLHNLSNLELSEDKFEPQGFDLKEFAERSFGVYQGEIYDVKLRFSPAVAEDVVHYNLHPTQKMRKNQDGSVTVTFKASGDKHIMWHLFKWGKEVSILAPTDLKKKYKEYLEEVLKEI